MTDNRTEHEIQRDIVRMLEASGLRPFAVPNGGARNMVVATRMKAEGVRPGVPDVVIPEVWAYLETKTATGRPTKEQREWLDRLNGLGYTARIVRSELEALAVLGEIAADEINAGRVRDIARGAAEDGRKYLDQRR